MTKVLVASAWPYVNSVPHLGNLIGSILSADVFARFARLYFGRDNVIFVSGSDEHGTPIEVEAKKRGVEPKALTDQAHEYDKNLFTKWEISFDNYTRTESETHKKFVTDFILRLRPYIREEEEVVPYCEKDKLFLPDRFIKGTCPYCGFPDARGDQCDNCGKLLTPSSLKDPKCNLCGSKPIFKATKHWFFDLSVLGPKIEKWLEANNSLPKNVKSTAMGWIEEGLKPRSLTRDNRWGIPSPFPGSEGKTIYVWFEALLGYISATIEYFNAVGRPDEWQKYWKGEDAISYYFVGKDNIVFHAVILPAMLIASGDHYVLPTNIPATEYLMYEGQKFSKSRKIGVWIDEALEIMDVEYWRYVLIKNRPEERDSNFTWREVVRCVNSDLNDDLGNLANRVLTIAKRNFEGHIPDLKEELLTEADRRMMEEVRLYEEVVRGLYISARLKEAVEKVLELVRKGNVYFNDRAPWELMKRNRDEAGNVINITSYLIKAAGIILSPVLPSSMSNLFEMMGLGNIQDYSWKDVTKPIHSTGVRDVKPLFKKLAPDFEKTVEERLSKIRESLVQKRPELLR